MKSWLPIALLAAAATAYAANPAATSTAGTTPAATTDTAGTVPAAGSPEDMILQSLKLFRDGKADDFIAKYCDAVYCGAGNLEQLRTYQLKHAMEHAKDCIHTGDTLTVTRTKGDFKADTRATIYVKCEADRMPVPVNFLKQADGTWRISGLSF